MLKWNQTTLPLAKIFWSILAIEILGFGAMAQYDEAANAMAPE